MSTNNGSVEIWPVDFDQEGITIKAHTTLGTASMALHADSGRVLGVNLFTGRIDDPIRHKQRTLLAGRTPRGMTCSAFSSDGNRVALGFIDGSVAIWDTASGALLRTVLDRPVHVTAIALSADGRRLALANRRDRVVVLDIDSGSAVRVFSGKDLDRINGLVLSGDGRRLVTGSSGQVVRLWDVETGRSSTRSTANSSGTSGARPWR